MRRRRGSVLVVVLVLISLASLLLAQFMEDNALELTMAAHDNDRRRLRSAAQSELELALAVIAEIRAVDLNNIHNPAQGYEDPHGYSGIPLPEDMEVQFDFEDESAKLPLALLDRNGLIQLLYALGLEQRDAERVSDSIVAWTSKRYESTEEEARDAAYERRELSHRPARRPIRSFEEFRAIGVAKDFFFDEEGRPTPLFESFRKCVSLYTFRKANINAASDAVLLGVGMSEDQVALIREMQSEQGKRAFGQPRYFRTSTEVRTLLGANAPVALLDDECQLLWVHVTVKQGLARCRVSALIGVGDDVSFGAPAPNPDETPVDDPLGRGTLSRASTATSTTGAGAVKPSTVATATPGVVPQTAAPRAATGGRTYVKTLTYPLPILAWSEDNGPAAPAPREDE
ncbi:MAG: hypothetical protein ACO268_05525 [Opitutales bacterium]|jgi:general secretion pathway protein K